MIKESKPLWKYNITSLHSGMWYNLPKNKKKQKQNNRKFIGRVYNMLWEMDN